MSVMDQMAMAWQGLRHAVALLWRRNLWMPWLLLGAVQAAVLTAMWWFAHPWISPVVAPVLRRLAGERALHYPEIFTFIPSLYARADLIVVGVLGSIMLGVSTLMFADAFHGRVVSPARAFATGLRRAGALVLVNLPFNVLVAVFSYGVTGLVADKGGLIQRLAYFVVLGGSIVIQAAFLYLTAILVLEKRNPLSALTQLRRAWRDGFWSALVLGILLLLPLLPLHFLSGQTSLIVRKGSPELVGVMVFLQIAVALLVWFLLAGSATLVYLSHVARRPQVQT